MKKAKFKMTEIGSIPEDWDVKRLGEVCENIRNGYNYDFREHGRYPMSRIETISSGEINYKRVALIEHEPPSEYKLKVGDILYSHINSLPYIGNIAQYDGADCLYHGMNLLLLRPNDAIDYMYLKYLLKSETMRSKARSAAKVAINQASISTRDLSEFQVAYPPLHEQKAIAEALSDVDELLAAMTTLIEKKRAIKQGAMQELLGMRNCEVGAKKVPRRRLPGFSGEWVEKRLGEIGEFIAGNGFPLNKQGGQSGKYPFFKVSDFNNVGNESALSIANNYISVSTFNELHCSLIPSGSIVFAKIGAAIALERKRRVCQDSCIDNNMMAFCVNKQNDERLVTECLRRIVFADLVESTALPALNVRKLREYKIIVPENISEQRAIAEVLSDMDAEIEALEAKRAKYESIKQSMMQELLTGKTRLQG